MGKHLQPKYCAHRYFSTCKIQVCTFRGRQKVALFKKLGKHWLGSPHLKRESGASVNARELTRGKKVYSGENLSPKHSPKDRLAQVKYTCRFEGGLKVASLQSYVSIG